MQHKKVVVVTLFLVSVIVLSSLSGSNIFLIREANAIGDLTIQFGEIGHSGVISPAFPTISVTVKDSSGNLVHGVSISIVNPAECPYYEWSITEGTNDYLITVKFFAGFAIKDDFQFVFTRTGYDTKTFVQGLAINAPYIEITDENGLLRIDRTFQFDMNAVPSHTMILNHFDTVFVNSAKYYVTYGYNSNYDWAHGFGYIVLDQEYNLVTNIQTREHAILTELLGQHFSHFPSQTLTDLADIANQMINNANGMWITGQTRDLASEILGTVVGTKLGAVTGKLTVAQQAVIQNFHEMRTFFEESMKAFDFVEFGEMLNEGRLIAKAGANLHTAGNEFLSLKTMVDAYRGTKRYEYNQIDYMFGLWVNSSTRMLVSADLIQGVLGNSGWDQVDSILQKFVEGATGFPITAMYDWTDVQEALRNNIAKTAQLRQDFWGWIWDKYANSTMLAQAIQATGNTKMLVPVPSANDFSITAYYQGNQRTSATISRGSSTVVTIQVNLISGNVPSVSLSVSGQDGTMTIGFGTQSAQPSFTSSLTISTSALTSGSYVLTITGTAGDLVRSSQVTLIITNPSTSGLVTLNPVDSPMMFGSWVRFQGTADTSYNGHSIDLSQSLDGGNNWYSVSSYGGDIIIQDGKWSAPSDTNLVGTQVYLSAKLGRNHPIDYAMSVRVDSRAPISNTIYFQLIKATSSATISIMPNVIVNGETLSITGTVYSGFGIPGSMFACKGTWYVDWRKNSGDWNSLASGEVYAEYVWLGLNNPYAVLFNLPVQSWTPTSEGMYEFRVRYSGDNNYESSVSLTKTVTVQSNKIPISVNINGLPANLLTNVYLDNLLADTLAGGSSKTYSLDQGVTHKISVEPIVNYDSNIRFSSQKFSQIIAGPGPLTFTYNKEYLLSTEILPAQSGHIQLSGAAWFEENSIVRALAVPSPDSSFDRWTLDGQYFGESESIDVQMSSGHLLIAVFTASSQKVATPAFSQDGGIYSSAQLISISCSTVDSTIRFTTDGSEPSSSSTTYSVPISVSSSTVTIKAKAFKTDMADSETASATYTIQPSQPAPALVGYWNFNENTGSVVHDSSGNENDGSINVATWVDGKVGKALQFNGVDSWVRIPSSSSLSGLSSITLEAWIKLESFSDRPKGIISKCNGWVMPSPDAEYALVLVDDNSLLFDTYNGNFLVHDSVTNAINNAETWYHVAATWTGTSYSIYVNGQLVKSGTNPQSSPYSNPVDLQIGRIGFWDWTYFHGVIDEVKIYNYARTSAEIQNDASIGEKTLFSDDFESYSVDTFPSNGGWELVFNGMGNQYQVITNIYSTSPSKSLQLWGNPNDWSAAAQKRFTSTSRYIGYEVSMMVSAIGNGGPGRVDYVGFYNRDVTTWGRTYASIQFNHDTQSIITDDGSIVGAWVPGSWYTIKVVLDKNTKTYSVWVNGQLKGSSYTIGNQDIQNINSLKLESDHPGVKDYFDDIRVFEIPTVSTQNVLKFTLGSPANILVTAPNGLRIGYDPAVQTVVNEIAGASYTGPGTEPQEITIPSPLPGTYIVDIVGTGSGPYTITVKSIAPDGSTIDAETFTGTISPGETSRATTQLFENGEIIQPSFNVVPEVPLGTIITSATMIIALIAYFNVIKWKKKTL